MIEYALFAGVARSLVEDEKSQGNLPTVSHSATLTEVVETEKLWPLLASTVASKKPAG